MKPTTRYLRATNFAILVIGLTTVTAMLGVLLHRVLTQAQTAEAVRHAYLVRLGYLVGVVLILTVLILAVVVIRYVTWRLSNPPEPYQPTGYEDAWTEAGRRLKAQDAPPVYPYEAPQEKDQQEEQN